MFMVIHGKMRDFLNKLIFFLTLCVASVLNAQVVEYNLIIEKKVLEINGRKGESITINGSIPGPVLIFKEGDFARIKVKNLLDEPTSIHWHGILVPPEMDGVPYVSFPPIAPKSEFTYEFPIRQSGTYWYHAHTELQEQLGLYGAFVIEPKEYKKKYSREYVILLSDWSFESPSDIIKTLKRGDDWYSIQKGNAQSLAGAIKTKKLKDFLKREILRMPPMDISDVAYDYFLANGKPEISLEGKKDEEILIRLINGSSSTNFFIEFSGGPMKIVAADGQDVEPFYENRFLIAVAETYDFVIKVPDNLSYEMRATSHDSSGFTSIWIGEGEKVFANQVPKPDLYTEMIPFSWKKLFTLNPDEIMGFTDEKIKKGDFDKPGLYHFMEEHDFRHNKQDDSHKNHVQNDHSMHQNYLENHNNKHVIFSFFSGDNANYKDTVMDGIDERRPYPPYNKLKSIKKTSYPDTLPVQEFRFTLDGDMKRYVWFLNGKALSESDVITIKANHIVRFILINRTMMHHPIHLHGHLFRVLNENGDYSPLKHTVNVSPMSTTVIEFLSNEVGDWFFHCHLLYHMKSGMANVVHYEGFSDPLVEPIKNELYKEHNYLFGEIKLLTNLTSGELTLTNTRNSFYLDWKAGWNRVSRTDWEYALFWERYFNQFFSSILGLYSFGKGYKSETIRGLIGIKYLLPFNIKAKLWIDTDTDYRLNFFKEFVLFPKILLSGEAEYDSHKFWEGKISINYILNKSFQFITLWHSKFGLRVGIKYKF